MAFDISIYPLAFNQTVIHKLVLNYMLNKLVIYKKTPIATARSPVLIQHPIIDVEYALYVEI